MPDDRSAPALLRARRVAARRPGAVGAPSRSAGWRGLRPRAAAALAGGAARADARGQVARERTGAPPRRAPSDVEGAAGAAGGLLAARPDGALRRQHAGLHRRARRGHREDAARRAQAGVVRSLAPRVASSTTSVSGGPPPTRRRSTRTLCSAHSRPACLTGSGSPCPARRSCCRGQICVRPQANARRPASPTPSARRRPNRCLRRSPSSSTCRRPRPTEPKTRPRVVRDLLAVEGPAGWRRRRPTRPRDRRVAPEPVYHLARGCRSAARGLDELTRSAARGHRSHRLGA